MEPISTYLVIGGVLAVTAVVLAPTLRQPDKFAASLDAGEHRETFGVPRFKVPQWMLTNLRGARVDIYDEALIISSLWPLRLGVRRSEVRELVRRDSRHTQFVRASDKLELTTTPEQHAMLERWLAGS